MQMYAEPTSIAPERRPAAFAKVIEPITAGLRQIRITAAQLWRHGKPLDQTCK